MSYHDHVSTMSGVLKWKNTFKMGQLAEEEERGTKWIIIYAPLTQYWSKQFAHFAFEYNILNITLILESHKCFFNVKIRF